MPNDPAQDGHIKSNSNMHEWDEVVFEDLGEMEIFWLKPGASYNNHAYRKLDMSGNVQNTKTREESSLNSKLKVYVRV
tara:strand:- start:459 stop:692 length:234 start_codon:yes stop_codon:yes gene_type:complete